MSDGSASDPSLAVRLEAAERERDQLRELLAVTPAMVCTLSGPEHVYTYVNNAFYAMVGRSRQLLGRPIREARPELAGQGYFEQLDAVYRTGEPGGGYDQPILLDRQGNGELEQAYIDSVCLAMRDSQGQITGLLIQVVDVTARVLAQERGAQQQRLMEHAGWGIAIGDSEGKTLVEVNPAFAAMHGYTVAELTGCDSSLVFAPQDRERKATEFVGIPNALGYYQYKSRHLRKDGSIFPCLTHVLSVKDQAGRVLYRVGNFQDLTELERRESELEALNERERQHSALVEAEVRRRTEELEAANAALAAHAAELAASDRYKDEFLSVISHELRTPLNFIMGFASILEDDLDGPLAPLQRESVNKILRGADRMLRLVDDLLDVAKLSAGRFDLLPMATPYEVLVDEVLGLLAPLAANRQLELSSEVAVAAPIWLDGPRIVQVLMNLVGNALKFTPPGGRVEVRAWLEGPELVTEVHDTGPGIGPEDMPRLFNRFQQLDMSATRRVGGVGLGLTIAKALIEAHGGTIGARSTPGVGSVFWFRLPGLG